MRRMHVANARTVTFASRAHTVPITVASCAAANLLPTLFTCLFVAGRINRQLLGLLGAQPPDDGSGS